MKHTRTGATGKASFFTPKDTSIFCNLRFYYLLNGPKKEITNTHQQKGSTRAPPQLPSHENTPERERGKPLFLFLFLSFLFPLFVCVHAWHEKARQISRHTHTRRERERERRGNMVKVAKTARTFDAVREFVVGFLSFYFLSLSLDVSRLDGLGLACRSAERSPSLSLSLSFSFRFECENCIVSANVGVD